jgi:hypothetical protein
MEKDNKKILLNDILNLNNLEDVKIRFNKKNDAEYDPIKFFKEDKERLLKGQFWNYSRNKSFKEGQIAIGFALIGEDQWLLFDISEVTKDLNKFNDVGYEHKTISEYEKYFGRIIIKYHNISYNMIRNAINDNDSKTNLICECEVIKILEDTFDNDIFPGYENVDLSWDELKRVVEKDAWKSTLENQKGVYLINDTNNGKMYVGSAYGETMILGRWKNYIANGHGGNQELKELDFDYIKRYFKYSILDIFKSTVDDKIIINRESWWKNVLQTRRFGYNKN